ncbi:MAG TPA: alpha/beta hydrolase [Chitinophagaceae bacterium]|nr:alpha/beta hydrolase [Chitinophagaceae bacterium]
MQGQQSAAIRKREKTRFRWLRILLRVLIILLGLFVIGCLLFDHFVQFRKSDDELRRIFAEKNIPARIAYYETHGRKLRYVVSGDDTLPTLLMLHGSPGSMSYYHWRMADSAIRGKFRVIAVDRPGYGYSGFGNPEKSIQKQSEMIRPLLDSIHSVRHPVILVGGSYGASIACRLTMDHPHLVDGLVLTGPAIGPGREKYFWFTHIIEHWSIRWFMPRLFRSANTEKVHHKKELEAMLPYWKNIRVPVVYLQGENDDIVDTSNASFARENLVNVPYLDIRWMKKRFHRLAQYEWPAIRQAILDVYQRTKSRPASR